MPNDSRIKTAFRSSILRESAEMIRTEQTQIASEWNLMRTGRLQSELSMQHFSVRDFETGARLTMRVLTYMRFLDMKGLAKGNAKRQAYHLYNKVVFGYLYNQTMPALKYGFTNEVQNLIRNKIKESIGTPKGGGNLGLLINMADTGDRNAQAIISKRMRRGYM